MAAATFFELNSFLGKFSQLCDFGFNTSLTFKNHNGNIIANIEAEPLNNDISENISKDQIDEDDDGFNLEPNTESLIGSKKKSMYKENGEMDHEYLDIPAFLRNQQD